VLRTVKATERLLGSGEVVRPDEVLVTDDYLGPGYGRTAPETTEAVLLAARREGLLLDPVYTGKSFAGLLGLARSNALPWGSTTVFLHTGGSPALFAYRRLMANSLA
jgi:1-aminocyclopropane-1-carboxylate deaminase/D-cysteine desulfhydrase-like pyridoxal-dependent ACC family enzyme